MHDIYCLFLIFRQFFCFPNFANNSNALKFCQIQKVTENVTTSLLNETTWHQFVVPLVRICGSHQSALLGPICRQQPGPTCLNFVDPTGQNIVGPACHNILWVPPVSTMPVPHDRYPCQRRRTHVVRSQMDPHVRPRMLFFGPIRNFPRFRYWRKLQFFVTNLSVNNQPSMLKNLQVVTIKHLTLTKKCILSPPIFYDGASLTNPMTIKFCHREVILDENWP